MLEDFCEICEGSEDKEGPGSWLLGVGTEGEGELGSLVTVSICRMRLRPLMPLLLMYIQGDDKGRSVKVKEDVGLKIIGVKEDEKVSG